MLLLLFLHFRDFNFFSIPFGFFIKSSFQKLQIGIIMLPLLFLPFLARVSLGCTTWKKGPCIIPYRVDGTIHTECLNREGFLTLCFLFLMLPQQGGAWWDHWQGQGVKLLLRLAARERSFDQLSKLLNQRSPKILSWAVTQIISSALRSLRFNERFFNPTACISMI